MGEFNEKQLKAHDDGIEKLSAKIAAALELQPTKGLSIRELASIIDEVSEEHVFFSPGQKNGHVDAIFICIESMIDDGVVQSIDADSATDPDDAHYVLIR